MDFTKMRRFKQQMDENSVIEILEKGAYGVLSVIDNKGYPYAVPVNYVYTENKIYFHCATQGHKLTALKSNDKVTFNIVAHEMVVPSELSTQYKSVIVFGIGKIVSDNEEKISALRMLVLKYAPEFVDKGEIEISETLDRTAIVRIDIEHVTGKFHN